MTGERSATVMLDADAPRLLNDSLLVQRFADGRASYQRRQARSRNGWVAASELSSSEKMLLDRFMLDGVVVVELGRTTVVFEFVDGEAREALIDHFEGIVNEVCISRTRLATRGCMEIPDVKIRPSISTS
ncbi:hypothetical protein HY380_00600 [Candidatus Saccharibacteria bacterium]|nr:hypothetical protein [Candidatus Saccharibacteria bacterium]